MKRDRKRNTAESEREIEREGGSKNKRSWVEGYMKK